MRRSVVDGRRQQPRRRASVASILIAGAVLVAIAYVFAVFWHQSNSNLGKLDGHGLPSSSSTSSSSSNPHPFESLTEEMMDPNSHTRMLRDQMTLAKGFTAVAKENGNFPLAWDFASLVRTCEQLLSRAALSKDREIGRERGGGGGDLANAKASSISAEDVETVVRDMAVLVFQARELHYDCSTTIVKLKAQNHALEERLSAASLQSTFFSQLAAEGVPKGLHCLGMRLTMDWALNDKLKVTAKEWSESPSLVDNNKYHFCLFTDNVLAAAVVVNSTVSNMREPHKTVFHLITDQMNFGAFQAWFALNPPGGAALEVQMVESFTWLNASYVPVLKQLQSKDMQHYYFRASMQDPKTTLKFRNPKYLSMLNHLRFYVPEIFPKLNKVVFLDDDIVVRKDLGPLFTLDMHGNVNGAVETCLETFHRFHKYLNFSHPLIRDSFDPEACGWAFGMNVFDLEAWRRQEVTKIYHHWQEANSDRTLWKLGTLPPGLLTFYGMTLPLERSWHVLGFGYDPNVDEAQIQSAAVLHWNGNMKPWLKIAMSRYKPLWSEYVNYSQEYIAQCNIH